MVEKLKGQLTSPQVTYIISSDELLKQSTSGVTYDTYRELRKDPTVSLARQLLIATVLSGAWSIEADEDVADDVIEFIKRTMLPLRDSLMEQTMANLIDFGWVSFEKVFELKNNQLSLRMLKCLLPDITSILIDKDTGSFEGVRQWPRTGYNVDLSPKKCLYIGFRVEGTYWYGNSLLEVVRATVDKWVQAEQSAANYDKKVAGSHFVVYYPPGKSIVNGVETDNYQVAVQLLTALENSGAITVPRTLVEYVDQLNATNAEQGWKVDVLSDTGSRQPAFVDRLKYLDALKVRAMMLPERAIIEGEFGTKAEASVHGDLALTNISLMDQMITTRINEQVVDQLLAYNYGEEYVGKVWLSPAPLVDEQAMFLKDLYKLILTNPQTFADEIASIDTDSIKDRLNIPKLAIVDKPEEGATPEQLAEMAGLAPTEPVEPEAKKNEPER